MLLLVEDEPLLLKTMTRYLEGRGFEVYGTGDPRAALAAFEERPEGYRAALLDHDLPELTGAECLEHLLVRRPDMPVLVMTGYSPETLRADPAFATARHILQKPVDLNDLEHLLLECLGSRESAHG